MDEPVTVRDVMNRSYVGVSEADSVAGAAGLMREEGVQSAVVLRGAEPVGILDESQLVSILADGRDPNETTAEEMMRPAVTVEVDEPLERAIAAMATDDARHLLVEEAGSIVATLSAHDIVTAYSVLGIGVDEPAVQLSAGIDGEAAIEGDPDQDVYSTQGVCESCGALTRELSNHNGQLLCTDCLAL